ncbi:MAG: hypothetical protein ACOCVN_00195, partial [bacterium]
MMNLNVNIVEKVILFLFLYLISLYTFGQKEIVGNVVSPSDDFLKNVKITVLEAPHLVKYTDDDGSFKITVEPDQHLIFEYQNNARKVISVSKLQESPSIVLDETSNLVNTGFGINIRKEEMASSIGTLSNEKINKVSAHT